MRAFWVLCRLRLLDMARSGATFPIFMGMPLVLLAVLAAVFANGHPFERREVIVVARPDSPTAEAIRGVLAAAPEVRLGAADDEARAVAGVRARTASAAVIVEGGGARLLYAERDGILARGLLAVLTSHAEVVLAPLAVPRWGYVHYLFPGLLSFAVLLAGLFGLGYAMVRYRANLFLKKLATTPLSRTSFVGAQLASRTLLVVLQLSLVALAGWLWLDVPLTLAGAGWLLVVMVLGLVTFTGLGFVMACVVKSEALIIDLINAVMVPLVLFSEIFFPLSELPAWLETPAGALPSTVLVRLSREVVLYGAGVGELWPGLLQLLAWAVASYAVAIAAFRWHR